MEGPALIWSDARTEVHRAVVGPVDNNVYIVRCRRTGDAALIDAANEHDVLLPLAASLGVTTVLETHGHWDHIQAVGAAREAGLQVYVGAEDAGELPGYDVLFSDDSILTIGDLRVRTIATPGHTPGSVSIAVEETPLLFTGDTLFPGGPGNTALPGGHFPTIMTSIEERFFRVYPADTLVWPGHGAPTTLGTEHPHFDDWVARGW